MSVSSGVSVHADQLVALLTEGSPSCLDKKASRRRTSIPAWSEFWNMKSGWRTGIAELVKDRSSEIGRTNTKGPADSIHS